MRVGIDLTNRKFGRLTAAWPVGKDRRNQVYWLCFCECGKFKPIQASSLCSGNTQSCGCLNTECLRIHPTALKHGYAHRGKVAPEHRAYSTAKDRCNNRNNKAYPYYGGRGIKFLFNSFEEFLAALGPKPSPDLSLDRVDNDGNYEPFNVRWATRSEQSLNRRPRRKAA